MAMLSNARTILAASTLVFLLAPILAAEALKNAIPLPDGLCVIAMRDAILERHPGWLLKDLKASKVRDLSFYQDGPVYHVVEVMTADESDQNPLGPVIIWLGLFKDGQFVRLAKNDEYAIYLKRFSQKH